MKIIKKFTDYLNESSAVAQMPPVLDAPQNDTVTLDHTEEDESEYVGNKMLKDLADALGVEVVNNSVTYEGQTINFFSETEKFHIGKNKFDTVDDVVEFLTNKIGPHTTPNQKPINVENTLEEEEEEEVYEVESGEDVGYINKFSDFSNEEEEEETDEKCPCPECGCYPCQCN